MRRISKKFVPSVLALVTLAGSALAVNYPITWLNMSPVSVGNSVPNSSVFNLPGVGNVTVTYSLPTVMTNSRHVNGFLVSGNVTSGPDNFSWGNFEAFSTIFTVGQDPLVPLPWRITYTFPSTLPAGSIYLGVSGLGRTTSFGGGASVISVNHNGTFLGDWQGAGGPWGPTLFNAGPPFTMENSVTGAGGADPWWNTKLGIVRIDDATNSLTIDASQIRGDGIGLNIGYCPVPAGACPVECPPNQRVAICYEAGRVDNFAAPVDPTTPRPFFQSLLSTYAISKPFDDTRVNAVCGTTFQNLPCGIATASLEIQLRAENDIPQNDSIYLQWLGSGFTWASPINALAGAGGTWNPGQSVTFTIPLNAAIINQMNLSNALDVLVSDDTTVEHARLSITTCPCNGPVRVYTVGITDNMASPTESTSRRARLTAIRTISPFLWKDNDDCTLDRGWGNTFASLPPGIVKADFNIRMKPCAGGASNDGMGFDLLNQGAPEAFSRSFNINLLPGAGGTWISNALTNFNFNLGATVPSTVCGSNLLGDFGDRTFDVYVQDDTGVDSARLRVWPCPPLRHIFGNPVILTGSAELALGPTGTWTVSNLAGSGNDGVEFDAHGSEGQIFEFAPGTFESYPVGTEVTIGLGGDVEGEGVSRGLGSGKVSMQDFHFMRVAPGPNGTGTCTGIRIRNSATGAAREACLAPGESLEVHSTNVKSAGWGGGGAGGLGSGNAIVFWKVEEGTRCQLPDGQTFHGDIIEMEVGSNSPETPIETCSFSWGISQEQSQGAMSAGISSVHTVVNGVAHEAVGESSTLNPNPASLTVANIGSSGQDGVRITSPTGGAWSFACDLTAICAGTIEECLDAQMQVGVAVQASSADGTAADVSSSLSGRRCCFFDIFADFSALGNPPVLGTITGADGTVHGDLPLTAPSSLRVATSGTPLLAVSTGHVVVHGMRAPTITYTFADDVTFSSGGLPPVVGRSITLSPEAASASMENMESVTITGTGMGELDLTNQQITPPDTTPPCFADFNNDGGVDGSDVSDFFAAWEAGDASADTNQDGGVDGLDVETFFAQWEAGGC